MMQRNRRRQGGFVLTVELLLILLFLAMTAVVGVVLIRDALIRRAEIKRQFEVIVKDADTVAVKPVSYDLCEAPQILCRDFGFDELNNGVAATPGPSEGLFALVGIRGTHLVSRNQVYFSGADCSGDPFLAPPAVPAPDGVFPPELPVGYYNCALQVDDNGDRVCFGVGPPSNWPCNPLDAGAVAACADGGTLFRATGAPATETVASRWISLSPDCAETGAGAGGSTGELIANGSFEDPAFANNGDFSPPSPASWTLSGSAAGHFDPCVSGEPTCSSGPVGDDFTVQPPDGSQIAYSNGPTLTQSVALPAAASCTLSVWVGCRTDSACAGGVNTPSFTVDVLDSGSASELTSVISGTLGAGSPEWQQFTRTFTVTGANPHSVVLDSDGPQTNFDAISLTCATAGAPAATAICDNFGPTDLALVPALQVTDMAGANVLAPFTPLFNVMAPAPPAFGQTAPTSETGSPPATGPLVPPTPEGS